MDLPEVSVARLTVCLTFDFDALSIWLGSSNPSEISRGEFAAVAVPRILRMLQAREIPATFFVPGHTASVYPDLVKEIVASGHEVGHHGWLHKNPVDLKPAEERVELERGLEELERAGAPRPVGWRSPSWQMSTESIGLLIEYGFLYSSNMMSNDFTPSYLRKGDVWAADGTFKRGQTSTIVDLPVYWGLDDFPLFEPIRRSPGLRSPSAVLEIWQGDFDYAYRDCPGGVYTLLMHPQVIGRGHRLLMVERLIDHMRTHDVSFSRMDSFAEAWRNANPL